MHISRFTSEVMDHLSLTEWKSNLELIHEIVQDRRLKRRGRRSLLVWVVSLLSEPLAKVIEEPFVKVYAALDRLLSKGLAEWRWRDTPEKLAASGGRRRMEWRLTQNGRRIRASLAKQQERSDEIHLPAPA